MKFFAALIKLIKETYNRIWEVNISLNSAAIAFYAIFSTAPLILIFIWIASVILGAQFGEAELEQTIQSIVGSEIAQSISKIVTSTSKGNAGFWSSLIAIFTLLFAATTLLSQMKSTLNKIWGVENSEMGAIRYYLWDRAVGLFFIGTLSLLFFLGIIAESLLYGLGDLLVPIMGDSDLLLFQIGSSLTNIVLTFIFFAAMFKILPDIKISWKGISVGALVTSLLFLAGKSAVDWYLSTLVIQPAYKAAGSFVIFLIWIYYNIQIILVGAIFTKVFTDRYERNPSQEDAGVEKG